MAVRQRPGFSSKRPIGKLNRRIEAKGKRYVAIIVLLPAKRRHPKRLTA